MDRPPPATTTDSLANGDNPDHAGSGDERGDAGSARRIGGEVGGTGTIDEVWRANRGFLVNLAARTLGERSEAEDVVQEAFGRLAGVPLDEIDDVRAWLTVVVRRLSLNRLGSAYRRREAMSDPGDDDVADVIDPADRVTLDDQVQRALAVVLDRLTPPERTSFVLHDVFGFPFDAIGEIVGRTPAACRQLASRARRSIRSDADPGPAPAPAAAAGRHRDLAERFAAACSGGDLRALMTILDPDVAGDAHLIGGPQLSHAEGRAEVASRILGLFGADAGTTLLPIDLGDHAGVIILFRGAFVAVSRLEATPGGDRIGLIHTHVLRVR